MLDKCIYDISQFSENIGKFLQEHLHVCKGFEARTFYAEAFSLNLLKRLGMLSAEVEGILRNKIDAKDRSLIHFHGEFLQYAMEDKWMDYPFKNNGVTNWILLRCLVNIRHNQQKERSAADAKHVIRFRQKRNGLVEDDVNVRSFQYHCFSLALIHELWSLTEDPFFELAFQKGLTFIKNFILIDGSSLYIGRGQEQLFGYASLVYILCLGDELDLLGKVVEHLKSYSNKNGVFPLVLREGEVFPSYQPNLQTEGYLGWYGYNNYFDYLSFAGVFFQKSCEVLLRAEENPYCEIKPSPDYCDGMFYRARNRDYEAVVAAPSGVCSNSMAFPYIVSNSHGRLTPCYGGEECLPSLFNQNDIPLPYFPAFSRTMKNRSRSWLSPQTLHLLSPLGYMRRDFQFLQNKITIETRVRSPFKSRHQYLFFDDIERVDNVVLKGRGFKVVSKEPLQFNRFAFCALGRLKVFDVESPKSSLLVEILN